MGIKFSNNASANITQALTSTATSVSVTTGKGDLFPSLVEGDYFYATLAGNNGLEIVKVTSRVNDTMTIVRAQDNTASLSFDIGDLFELRIVAADFDDTFSHVETTLNATISNVETTLEDTVNALNYSVNNKMSSYLPLAGGEMTGMLSVPTPLVVQAQGGDFEGGQIELNPTSSIRFKSYIDNYNDATRIFGALGDTVQGRFDIDHKNNVLRFNDHPILTSAGGTMAGNIVFQSGNIVRQNPTGELLLCGGTAWNTGAFVAVHGQDHTGYEGVLDLTASRPGYNTCQLFLAPGEMPKANGSPVLTSAGGTMNGVLFSSIDHPFARNVDNAKLIFCGGSDGTSAHLALHGKNLDGKFYLVASNDNGRSELIGEPAGGNLTWNSSPVLTAAGGVLNGKIIINSVGQIDFSNNATYRAVLINRDIGNAVGIFDADSPNGAGSILLRAADTEKSCDLWAHPSGHLTWGGGTVVPLVASWSDGVNWYRKYSDGWIEQGGRLTWATANWMSTTINLHTPFSNTNYGIFTSSPRTSYRP